MSWAGSYATSAVALMAASAQAQVVPTPDPSTQTPSLQTNEQATAGQSLSESTADQPSPAPDTGDIIVTAQRRSQSLQRVPISVAVASGEQLAKANLVNLEQLGAQLPAVRITQTAIADQLYIRGAGSGLNGGFEQSVSTFVDGVYRGRARSSRSALFDVERVEVLKGPQTTFFGNNAIAGAFNITTRKPGQAERLNAVLLYEPSDGEYSAEVGYTSPLTDRLSLRVAGRAYGMDGYVRNENLDRDEPRIRDWIGRVALAWDASEKASADLRVDVGRTRTRGVYPGELTNCPTPAAFGPVRGVCAGYLALAGSDADTELNLRTANGGSSYRNDFVEVVLSTSFELGSHDLAVTSSYFHHDNLSYTNVLPTQQPGLFGSLTGLPTTQIENYDQQTHEIRLSSPAGERLEYMVGAYLLSGDLDYDLYVGYNFAPFGNLAGNGYPANSPVVVYHPNEQRERTYSVFGSVKYKLTDALRLSAGLRYSRVRKAAAQSTIAGPAREYPDFPDLVGAPPAAQVAVLNLLGQTNGPFPISRRIDDAVLPSAGVEVDLVRDVLAYASYTEGFKAGGFSFATPEVFRPEKVKAYEIGLKTQAFDRALTLNIAAFLSDYSDLQEASQVLLPNGASRSVIGNSAKSRSKGVEISSSLRLAPTLSFRAEVGYLDARYVSYLDGPCTTLASLTPGCVQDQSGARRAFSPKWSGSIATSFRQLVGSWELRVDPVLAFTSRFLQQSLNDRLYEQSGYAKLDVRVSLGRPADGLEFAIVGRNLTDEITASFRNTIPSSPGAVLALPDRDRSIAFQITLER